MIGSALIDSLFEGSAFNNSDVETVIGAKNLSYMHGYFKLLLNNV